MPRASTRTNALLHAAASASLVLFAATLGVPLLAAALAGLLFATHPVHTEAVAWIVGRADVLAGLFSFLSAAAWARFRRTSRTWFLLASAAAYFLGLAAKETAAPLPAILLLGDLVGVFPGRAGETSGPPVRSARPPWGRTIGPYAVLAAVFLAYVALRVQAVGRFGVGEGAQAFRNDSPETRFATALAGFARYALLTVFPVGLRVDYEGEKVGDLLHPSVAAGLVVAGALGAATLFAARQSPWAACSIAWWLLFLLPCSNLVVPLGSVYAERFLYIPSAGACVLAGAGFARALASARTKAVRLALLGAAAGLLCAAALLTLKRNRDWSDAERFWRKAVAESPRDAGFLASLAQVLSQPGGERKDEARLEEAERLLYEALAISEESGSVDRTRAVVLLNLVDLLRSRGKKAEAVEAYDRLLDILDRYRVPIPRRLETHASVVNNRGTVLFDLGEHDKAGAAFEEAARLRPEWALPRANLSNLLLRKGDRAGALARANEAVALDPGLAAAHKRLGLALRALGDREGASDALATAASLGDQGAVAPLLETTKETYEEALSARDYARAYRLVHRLVGAGANTAENAFALGWLSDRLEEKERARHHYREALRLDPNHERAKAALGAPGG